MKQFRKTDTQIEAKRIRATTFTLTKLVERHMYWGRKTIEKS